MLALPYKRVFFAGEHTSAKRQGYMNGAVESDFRAAEEVFATMQSLTPLLSLRPPVRYVRQKKEGDGDAR